MTKGRIIFQSCIQKNQNYSSGERSMRHARVFFTMSISAALPLNLFVDITQPFDTDFEKIEIEVGPPVNHKGEYIAYSGPYNHTLYKGPYNHRVLSGNVEQAYRDLVGVAGSGFRIKNSSNIVMSDNRFQMNQSFEMELGEAGQGPW